MSVVFSFLKHSMIKNRKRKKKKKKKRRWLKAVEAVVEGQTPPLNTRNDSTTTT
jgi:hypothetical protein